MGGVKEEWKGEEGRGEEKGGRGRRVGEAREDRRRGGKEEGRRQGGARERREKRIRITQLAIPTFPQAYHISAVVFFPSPPPPVPPLPTPPRHTHTHIHSACKTIQHRLYHIQPETAMLSTSKGVYTQIKIQQQYNFQENRYSVLFPPLSNPVHQPTFGT